MNNNPGPTDTQLLFPEREFDYNGLTVVVRAVPARKVLHLFDTCQSIVRPIGRHSEGNRPYDVQAVNEALDAFRKELLALLNQSVEVRGISPQPGVLDLPFKMIPQLLHAFLELNFDLGNWYALGQALGLGPVAKRLIESMTSIATLPSAVRS